MKFLTKYACFIGFVTFTAGCNSPQHPVYHTPIRYSVIKNELKSRARIYYHIVQNRKHLCDSLSYDDFNVLLILNRVDSAHLITLDSLLLPDTFLTNRNIYSPFPAQLSTLDSVEKVIFYSYPLEAFGAYQNGKLVRWGPVSMGKKSTLTPTGLFFTNWKAKKTTSTFNDEWIMNWYFNLANYAGVSMHEYELPGYPASHACVRMLKDDAYFFYHWCNQWVLDKKNAIIAYGTPVIIFGSYPFRHRKPWLAAADTTSSIDLTEKELSGQVQPYLSKILTRQHQRREYFAVR